MLMKATAVHRSSAITPSAEIGSPAAKIAIVARRARVPDQPRRMKNAGSQPPKMLPRSAPPARFLVASPDWGTRLVVEAKEEVARPSPESLVPYTATPPYFLRTCYPSGC